MCDDIDKAIRLTVQKNLTTMRDDCDAIVAEIANARELNGRRRRDNASATAKGWALMVFGWTCSPAFYVAVLEACATKPVTTALRTHALPALAAQPVFRDLVEGLLPDGGGGGSAWNMAARW